MTPSQTELDTILELVRNTPENERSDLEKAALQEFRDSYFKFEGLDPSGISAALSHQPKELREIYYLLRKEDQLKNPPAPKAPETYGLKDEEPAPRPKSAPVARADTQRKVVKAEVAPADSDLAMLIEAADQEVEGEEKKKGKEKKYAKGDAPAQGPRTARGGVMAVLNDHGMLDDEAAGKMLRDNDSTGKWKDRAGIAAKLSLALALGTGAVLGVRGIVAAKKAAENVGGEVQKIQDNVGNMADNIATNPLGAPIPQRGQDSTPPTQEGAGVGKHTNQLKDKAKDASLPDAKQKGR